MNFVFNGLDRVWRTQTFNVRTTVNQKMYKTPTSLIRLPFEEFRDRIAPWGLDLTVVEEQALDPKLEAAPEVPCRCKIKTTHGMPCRHRLWQCLKETEYLRPHEVHPFWHFQRNEDSETAADEDSIDVPRGPIPTKQKSRLQGAVNHPRRNAVEAGRREPSQFELAARFEAIEAVPRPSPPSTAPAALATISEQHYIPGTQHPRRYQNSVDAIGDALRAEELYITPEIEDTITDCIVVHPLPNDSIA